MKENNYHAKLLTVDGEELSCTIKTPKLKLVREFRKAERNLDKLRGEYATLEAEKSRIAETIAAKEELLRAKDDEAIRAEVAQLRKDEDANYALKEENDSKIYQELIDKADLVIIYPNKKDVTEDPVRTKDDIDWEGSDLREIRGAVDFFADQSSSSSFSVTK